MFVKKFSSTGKLEAMNLNSNFFVKRKQGRGW
jgi:hypothetical protein